MREGGKYNPVQWYIETLIKVITSPILFFQDMPKGSWKEDSLSFALVTGWIMALALTFVVFVNSYLPTGLSLIEGIAGKKLIIVIPVLAVMGFVFFAMTALIVGGMLILMILGLLFMCAAVLNFLLILLGGSGNIFEVIKATLYTSGALLAGLINIFLMICVKYKLLSFSNWIAGERVIYYAVCIYLYGLFGILGKKTHKVTKLKALLAAAVPVVVLILVNIIFSSKILPKFAGFLG